MHYKDELQKMQYLSIRTEDITTQLNYIQLIENLTPKPSDWIIFDGCEKWIEELSTWFENKILY